jgi:hypothetical protein
MNSQRLRVVVSGLIAQHPVLGGMTWHYLQYLIGLAALGHDVYYIEDSGMWPYNLDGGPDGTDWIQRDCSGNVEYLDSVLSRFGLGDRWAFRSGVDGTWHGMSEPQRAEVVGSADLVLNVSGSLMHPWKYRGRGLLVYIDSDPGFTQVKIVAGTDQPDLTESERLDYTGFAERVDAHDVHFTFAEGDRSTLPTTRHSWRPTRQPIVIDEWRRASDAAGSTGARGFTTVMSWSSYRPLVWRGYSLGQKDVEFRAYLPLPTRCPSARLEVALFPTRHMEWESDEGDGSHEDSGLGSRLRSVGWRTADAAIHCAGVDRYREYIRNSTAEWSVAKSGYIAMQCGWFSERTGCYLAAGRPAVVQDTGLGSVLSCGEGLVTFSNIDEAAAGIDSVLTNYAMHSRSASELARDRLDARVVLTHLIDDAFRGGPASSGNSAAPRRWHA